ncbi:MAG: bifunctional UDP-N-acetylglucosamine diphosphorylase/glucosamine-1-phosphate N-acetyltransferase GlmU [Cyanobacteria bacterium P01_H01_bin.74]
MAHPRAIIMAAGKGTRLKSQLPKVLHPLMGKPLLQRVLETLPLINIEEACIIVGHQADQVKDSLVNFQLPFSYTTALQDPQLGTGHAVQQVHLQCPQWQNFSGTALILSGDVPLMRAETLSHLLKQHAQQNNALTVLAATCSDPTGYGRIVCGNSSPDNPKQSAVKKIIEHKDATPQEQAITLVNTGIYAVNWALISPLLMQLSNHNKQAEFYLTDVVALAVNANLSVGMAHLDDATEMLGVNARSDLAQCHSVLNQRTLKQLMVNGVSIPYPQLTVISPEVSIGPDSTVLPGCLLEGDITIGNDCTIGPNTIMNGTVRAGDNVKVIQSVIRDTIIGSHVSIGPFAQLRDQVTLADTVHIGNFVEIKQSSIDSHTNVAHLAYVGNATLGNTVNIGAGTITANYDPIRDIKSETQIGNGAKIGSNTVLVAPVSVASEASVAAGSVITKDVSEGSLAIARGRQTEIEGWVKKTKAQATEQVKT